MNAPANCNHIMPDGHCCGSPAMRHHRFCYFHNQQRKKAFRIKYASCPYFPRIPIDPATHSTCPVVLASQALAEFTRVLQKAQPQNHCTHGDEPPTPAPDASF